MRARMVDKLHDLSYVARYSRLLFKKKTWLKVGALISSCQSKSENSKVFDHSDALGGLKRANWNMVSNTRDSIGVSTSPLAIVILQIDMSGHVGGFSTVFIDECLRKGSIYGSIEEKTHVVVQLFFTNIGTELIKVRSCDTETTDQCEATELSTVGTVMVDSTGVSYSYNLPVECEQIAFECVGRLMVASVNSKPSIMLKMTSFDKRSRYDDYVYAMFLASVCAYQTSLRCKLVDCRPSKEVARPSRVITNLRFLMLLSSPVARNVVDDLLLDELNVLDVFRRVVMDIRV